MTLAVGGTLCTYKQSNKQKETKNTQYQHDVQLNNKYGNGFWDNLTESEAKTFSRDLKKRNTSCRIRWRQIDHLKTWKMIPARNSHITNALNLITYSALWRPFWWRHHSVQTQNSDVWTGLNCYLCPRVYFDIGHQKLSQNLHEILIRHRL